jgi:hypothetical protein
MSNPVITFFEKIGSKLASMFKKAPSIEVQVSSAINYCAPFVEELDTLVDPTLAPIINPIIDKVKTGLAALAVTIQQASTPTGQTNLQSIFSSLKSNLSSLESAAQVKNPENAAKFSQIVNLIIGEISAISTSVIKA